MKAAALEMLVVGLMLALIVMSIGLLGVIWEMHLTIEAQDQLIDRFHAIKCPGEIPS